MLVLTRRETEKILFPSLDISIEVVRVQGNRVRLGIDAPSDVPVVRDEIADLKSIEFSPDETTVTKRLRIIDHAVRRRLDLAANALNQLDQELDEHACNEAHAGVLAVFRELQALEKEVNCALEGSAARPDAEPTQALIIDGNPSERNLLESYLTVSGFEVTTANDDRDALDYLSMHSPPDVVLLDMMPRCDGPNFVRQFRSNQRFAGTKLFAVCGVDPSELGVAMDESGIDGWFPRPVNPEKLVDTISKQTDHGTTVA